MTEIFDDIKKMYRFGKPVMELHEYIEFFSESSLEQTIGFTQGEAFTVKMFPSWTPTIWINLGSPYRLTIGNRLYTINKAQDVLVLRDTVTTRYNLASDHILTIKFFPGGLERILQINQTHFIDKVVNLADILPPSLIGSIKKQNSFEDRKKLLEDYFLLCLQNKKRGDHYLKLVQDSIDLYHHADMQYNTTEIAEKMFITSKTINRYFNTVIGTSPKKYFSILRARKALSACIADKLSFLPTDYGYYDMSHFYRESAKFTGYKMGSQE